MKKSTVSLVVGMGFSILLLVGCGTATKIPVQCVTDQDCVSQDACRTGKCNLGKCEFSTNAGYCFVDDKCYMDGDKNPDNLCELCDADASQAAFTPKACNQGEKCDTATGECKPETLEDAFEVKEDVQEDISKDQGATDPGINDNGTDPGAADNGGDTSAPECATKQDCIDKLNPGPCQFAFCFKGTCQMDNLPKDSTCRPNSVESPLSLDCVTGKCDEKGACVEEYLSDVSCDDGNLCTQADTCNNGVCQGTAKKCGDNNLCTKDYCDKDTGKCHNDKLSGMACDDGNSCTTNDKCDAGVCVGGKNVCDCQKDKDCKDDNDLCNGIPKCVTQDDNTKKCEIDPNTVVKCDSSKDTQCEVNTCVPATGNCKMRILVKADCDDGDKCTVNDTCTSNGTCKGRDKVCVDDGNECTQEFCNEETGNCDSKILKGNKCDDNNACTPGSECNSEGVCEGKIECDDNNDCTKDECNPIKGCYHDGKVLNGQDCDDNNDCTMGTTCLDKKCQGGTSICECQSDADCKDDGDLCNGTPKCVAHADGSKTCEVDPDSVVSCDTSSDPVCKTNTCNPKTGKCDLVNDKENASCNDGNVCTINDVCDGQGQCAGRGVAGCCNKSDDCETENACLAAKCESHKCKFYARPKNFDECFVAPDDTPRVCWNGNCLKVSAPQPKTFAYTKCAIHKKGATFTSVAPVYTDAGTVFLATGMVRVQDYTLTPKDDCDVKNTWTDVGYLYEFIGNASAKVGEKKGDTGDMEGFYNTALLKTLSEVADKMVVGRMGLLGLIDTTSSPVTVDWNNAPADLLAGLDKEGPDMNTVWHGIEREGSPKCFKKTDFYFIGADKAKTFVCTNNTANCSETEKCSCSAPLGWECHSLAWTKLDTEFPVMAVTGDSTCNDLIDCLKTSSVTDMTAVSERGEGGVAGGLLVQESNKIEDIFSLGSEDNGTIGDMLNLGNRKVLFVGSKAWEYYDLDKKELRGVTPDVPEKDMKCEFRKGFAYGSEVLVVAVCSEGTNPTSLSTYLYYADCIDMESCQKKQKVKLLGTFDINKASVITGRAVAASRDTIYVVGGDDSSHGEVFLFFQ